MSLINEALKRADEEKRQHQAGVTPPGPLNSAHGAPRRRWGRRLLILGGAVLIVMALAAYGVWWTAGRMIRQAAAAVDQLAEQSAALAVGPGESTPIAPVTPPPSAPGPNAQAPASAVPAPTSPAPADALAGAERKPTDGPGAASTPSSQVAEKEWRPDGLAVGGPSAPPPAKTETAATPDPQTTAKKPDPPPTESAPAAKPGAPAKAPDAKPPVATAPNDADPKSEPKPPNPGDVPAPQSKPPPEKPAPEAKAPEKPPTPAPPDTSAFKISSIMVGPRGGTAIINGQSVHVGDTIGGAKVLEITRREVLVEIGGQRVALRM